MTPGKTNTDGFSAYGFLFVGFDQRGDDYNVAGLKLNMIVTHIEQ